MQLRTKLVPGLLHHDTGKKHVRQQDFSVRQQVGILGSTGSIGTQTLDVIRLFPEKFQVRALSAGRNVKLLAEQAREFRPDCVVIEEEADVLRLRRELAGIDVRILAGREGLREAATLPDLDTIVAALVGFAGLDSVLAALSAGKKVALANKETLVVAGRLVNEQLALNGGVVIPVDSEHSAIFQCLVGEQRSSVEELILTASGGPFRTRPRETFDAITREEALNHPNWSMGSKITIDSATMMNKGLEVIEAHWLFGIEVNRIRVLVHPQSIVHSLVTFEDGSTKAQLGRPDMKVPIQYALTYPERWKAPHERINWGEMSRLEFEEPDPNKFACLRLAYEAIQTGGTAPAVLNAANEQAVALFLENRIRFVDIPGVIQEILEQHSVIDLPTLEDLVEVDAETRALVLEQTRAGTI
ncbi:MAG: 1-deoxy-D-xylulose-5-phosphate reductoisomerase [Rhodothermales bacterium]